jgi:uncharacterized SAM-binding protein YcdF (DUF218 family)
MVAPTAVKHRDVRRPTLPLLSALAALRVSLLSAFSIGFLALGLGFLWFVTITQRPSDAPAHADAVVVLTGGADRVETGLHLLADGRADRLLVSGVAHGAELAALAHLAGLDPTPLAPLVTLGHAASTTRGNAAETAAWANLYSVHTVILVTGFYHMPRALAELSRACPALTFYRAPVVPAAVRARNFTGLRLLLQEYAKYLAVEIGATRLLPPDSGQPPSHSPAQHNSGQASEDSPRKRA